MVNLVCNVHRPLDFAFYCTSLTKTAHQPLGSNAWHNVRVLLGASILLGLQDTVGIL